MFGQALRRVAGRETSSPARAIVQTVQGGFVPDGSSQVPSPSAAIIADLEARLDVAQQALEGVRARKKRHALAAVNGDEYAAEVIGRIDLGAASTLRSIELLKLALEDAHDRAAQIDATVRAQQESYRARLPSSSQSRSETLAPGWMRCGRQGKRRQTPTRPTRWKVDNPMRIRSQRPIKGTIGRRPSGNS